MRKAIRKGGNQRKGENKKGNSFSSLKDRVDGQKLPRKEVKTPKTT